MATEYEKASDEPGRYPVQPGASKLVQRMGVETARDGDPSSESLQVFRALYRENRV